MFGMEQTFLDGDMMYESHLSISTPRILDRLREFNKDKDYYNQIQPSNFSLIGFSNVSDNEKSLPIKQQAYCAL